MKVDREKQDFQPVTIVIETQGEADLLAAALGSFAGNHENDMLYKLFCALDRDDRKYKVNGSSPTIWEA